MTIEQYENATEYLANEITILRGDVSDITSVGVFHSTNPNVSPVVGDFTAVTLVDGTDVPVDPLEETGKIDVLSLVGPKAGSDLSLGSGDYQRFVLVQTAAEDIIRKVDTVTIL